MNQVNIQKELLTIEFRYLDRPKGEWDLWFQFTIMQLWMFL